jgi:hypothetical protein
MNASHAGKIVRVIKDASTGSRKTALWRAIFCMAHHNALSQHVNGFGN